MALKTWSQYHTIATSTGASGLAEITDASSDSDPSGTQCNKSYWEAHAYDALEVIFSTLGSSPGSGIDGTVFTINADASSAEHMRLDFNYGSGAKYLKWHTSGYFQFNEDVYPETDSAYNLGSSSVRWKVGYFDEIDATTITGSVVTTGTASDAFTLDSDDTIYTAGTGQVKLIASRASDAEGDAELQWDEGDGLWYLVGPDPADGVDTTTFHTRQVVRVADDDTITAEMLDESSVYAGSGGNYGTASEAAREDHAHATGPSTSSGTTSETYTIDNDYASGSVNIEYRFASSANFIRYDPSVGDFVFSDTLKSDTHNTDDLGTSSVRWKDLYLSGDADIDGNVDVAGTFTVTGTPSFKAALLVIDSDGTNYAANAGLAGIKIDRGTATDVTLHWDEVCNRWKLTDVGANEHTLVTHDQDQTLSNKALSSPVLSSGSWSGNPTFSGSPVFNSNPTFSGTPNFTGNPNFGGRPTFSQAAVVGPPFSVTSTQAVSNLNADRVDGKHSSDFMLLSGAQSMSGDLNMGGHDITNLGSLAAHQSTHMSGGGDALSGALGSGVTGIAKTSWRIGTNSLSGATGDMLYLGGGNSHTIAKVSLTAMSLAGYNIDIIPGTTSGNQDLGITGRRWRSIFINSQVVLQEISGTAPTSVENGSLWAVDGGAANGYVEKIRTRLNGTAMSIINEHNKTDMIGCEGDWTIDGGDLYIGTSGWKFSASGGTLTLSYSGFGVDSWSYP